MKTTHSIFRFIVLAVLLTAGYTMAQATVSGSMTFEGRTLTNGSQSQYAWRIQGFLGTASSQQGASGTSQTFNNQRVINGANKVTINGTLNFAEASTFTDVTTGSQVTLTFESSNYWFYGATVKTLSDANVTGCSYSISSDSHTITVTIPSGKTFGNVYLECVNHAPMTNDNTTVTVPAGDYWVSNSSYKPTPEPTVVYGNTTLVKDTDYTLSWSNNSSAGTGTVTVTGKGNYTGSVSANFNIRWARYYVHFDKNHNDATGTMSDQQFTYNTAQNLTTNAFSHGSYPFAGWSTTPNGAVTYTDGQSVSNLTAVDGETVTLYAQWTPPYTFNSTTGVLTLNWGEFNKDNNWGDDIDPSAVTSVTATNEVSFTGDCFNLFYYFTNCTSMDLSNVNTDGLTNIRCMFWKCLSLTTLDLSSWNTAAVTAMKSAFYGCTGLTSLNLSGWNTANVTNMSSMFKNCSNLQSLDLSGWNTAKVTDMSSMFNGCSNLQSLDLSGWNTANVTRMDTMFGVCTNLATIYVGEGWSTSHIYSSDGMFDGCTSLVGGRGTTYDENHINEDYARIDMGPNSDQPGYFTGSGPVKSITVDPDEIEMNVGATYTIIFTVLPTYATNKAVTFTSSDATVATVDANGDVTGVAAGTTTITIAATDGSGVTGTFTVTVTNISVEEIIVADDDITIRTGETAAITYTVLPQNATIQDVTFTSANTAIATVDANGTVTGVGGGETTITIASVSNPEVTTNVSVTVPGDRYQLFTGDLEPGDYLIVCNGKAMEREHTGVKFYYKEVTAIDNVITTDDADIIWHIAPNNEGYWTIYNDVAEKYVAEYTKIGQVALYDDISFEQTHWIFSQYETSYDIVNRFFNGNSLIVHLSYRYGSINGFGCSDLSHGDDRPSLYKKVEVPVTETYTFDSTTSATLLGETKYVTTFYQSTYNYRLPDGALAYTASLDNGRVVFHRIGDNSDIIPKNTAVIIVSDTESISLTILSSTTVTAHAGNILQGKDTPVTVTNGQIDGKTVYVLGKDENGMLGFYRLAGNTIPAGKAYYVVE